MTTVIERAIPADQIRTGDRLTLNGRVVTHAEAGDEVVTLHHRRGSTTTIPSRAVMRVQRRSRIEDHDQADRETRAHHARHSGVRWAW